MTEHESSSHQNKGFFESFSSKTSFFIGLIGGILIICAVGFFVLLGITLSHKNAIDDTNSNNNVAVNNNNQAQQPTDPNNPPSPQLSDVSKPTSADHVRGSLNAKVVMIEYSDFQCPYCKMAHATLKQLVSDYKGQVAWVFRNFPLESIHPYAKKGAEAAECASEQGKFWEYADKLYDNQSSFSDTYFTQAATELGLDMTKFNSCLTSEKYSSKIEASAQEAAKAGITGTPGIFVNDQFVRGALPIDNFKQVIDTLVK